MADHATDTRRADALDQCDHSPAKPGFSPYSCRRCAPCPRRMMDPYPPDLALIE